MSFNNRGKRCEEQILLLRKLWTETTIHFEGQWDQIHDLGIDPLPVQRPIPVWIAANGIPTPILDGESAD